MMYNAKQVVAKQRRLLPNDVIF